MAADVDQIYGAHLEESLKVVGAKPLRHEVYGISYRKHVEYILEMLNRYAVQVEDSDDLKMLSLIRDDLELMHRRSVQDAKKLTQILFTDKFTGLRDKILNGEIEYILPPSMPDEGKDHHAEMNIISYIIENYSVSDDGIEIYIGISKKSCYGCELDFMFVNEEYKPVFLNRGTHARKFDTRMDTIWSEDARRFFSDALNVKKEGLLFAELSDSDGEEVFSSLSGDVEDASSTRQ